MQNRYCNPISVLHAPYRTCKTDHSLRFIYWAKSATLTAYCSQFRNNYFQKYFYWLCQLGNTQTLLYDVEEENFFTLLKKKLLATLKFFIFFKKENLIYVAFILKICYNKNEEKAVYQKNMR